MIRLATVSPCYNEEEVLRHSVERLTALFERMISEGLITPDSMMVFVNDGSRDRTWQIIRELHAENKFVKGINMSRNVPTCRTTSSASPRWCAISRQAMISSMV